MKLMTVLIFKPKINIRSFPEAADFTLISKGNLTRPECVTQLLHYISKEYTKRWDCKVRHLLSDFSIDDIVSSIVTWLDQEIMDFYDLTTFARDIYIGSDLTKKEKKDYYQALVNHGFFSRMNKFLYSSNYGICSWTIYTVGKFSHKENAILLEDAYNRHYKNKNPMLCHRCLGELHWLKPGQAEPYLEELQKNPSLTNLLILFYYFDSMSYDPRYKQLIENEMLACAILADSIVKKKRDKIEEKA